MSIWATSEDFSDYSGCTGDRSGFSDFNGNRVRNVSHLMTITIVRNVTPTWTRTAPNRSRNPDPARIVDANEGARHETDVEHIDSDDRDSRYDQYFAWSERLGRPIGDRLLPVHSVSGWLRKLDAFGWLAFGAATNAAESCQRATGSVPADPAGPGIAGSNAAISDDARLLLSLIHI